MIDFHVFIFTFHPLDLPPSGRWNLHMINNHISVRRLGHARFQVSLV